MNAVIKNFAPSWPATVMGTAILPIALSLSASSLPWMKEAATTFFALSVAMLAVITLAMAVRLVAYPADFAKEFRHPVAGSFIPTLPIAFIIVAIDFLTLGAPFLGEGLSTAIATWLFGIGAAGIWLLGLAVLTRLFASTEVKPGHATFGWFIPPVSQIIIAVGGLELVKHLERGPGTDFVYILALAGLGIGTVLFLFVGAAVYSAEANLPDRGGVLRPRVPGIPTRGPGEILAVAAGLRARRGRVSGGAAAAGDGFLAHGLEGGKGHGGRGRCERGW
ncbi:MAG: hypothetical protein WCL50_16725, partial [Spirochaetota bacterium]